MFLVYLRLFATTLSVKSVKSVAKNDNLCNLFLKNKPDFPLCLLFVTIFKVRAYVTFAPFRGYENKANSNPILSATCPPTVWRVFVADKANFRPSNYLYRLLSVIDWPK